MCEYPVSQQSLTQYSSIIITLVVVKMVNFLIILFCLHLLAGIPHKVFPSVQGSIVILLFSITINSWLFFFNKFLSFIYLALLGFCCRAWAFSRCGEQGLLFLAVCGLLIAVASLVVEHGL